MSNRLASSEHFVLASAGIRVATPAGESLPSAEVAEQAANIVIHGGKRHKVTVDQATAAPSGVAAAGGTASVSTGAALAPTHVMDCWCCGSGCRRCGCMDTASHPLTSRTARTDERQNNLTRRPAQRYLVPPLQV